MEPRIVNLPERKLVGKRLEMTFADNQTAGLWRSFMPNRKLVDALNDELVSAAVYPENFFAAFDLNNSFEKWAVVEVGSFEAIPEDMQTLVIPAGTYAVFHYVGSAANANEVFGYIFNQWLPASGYRLDNRPHFEILGAKYRHDSPDSEEDIYIPVTA